ncbi:MAG: 4-alpha-glucanotransferase [Flaviaesturariibacter sp.]|nr:4-alpha-glucanotransferase [Flaviaesturariibacter sp.]
MFDPISTYRFQFHAGFTFAQFKSIIPYLQRLGVSTVYASPIFEAVPGSTHGYDGLAPNRINPEIGTEEELREISGQLKAAGISWLQDIVPNHMAFHPRNEWLMDVLEKGPKSPYASFFDMAGDSPVLVPFLGASLEEAINKGDLKLAYDGQRLALQYYEAVYPLSPFSYELMYEDGESGSEEILNLITQFQALDEATDEASFAKGWQDWLQSLAAFTGKDEGKAYIKKQVDTINSDPEKLLQLAQQQHYQLSHWQETDRKINYRRFFTVNGLICLNIQHDEVFATYHSLIKKLVDDGVFQGLRIDHIDGLYDPTQYLQQLRQLVGHEVYIIAEKILESHEQSPGYWPIQGNTGYDFLATVNNLFTKAESKAAFTQFYYGIAGDHRTVQQQVRDSKAHILHQHMGGELENLCRLFYEQDLVQKDRLDGLPSETIKAAIAAFLVHCPVYRFYSNILPLTGNEATSVQNILEAIRQTDSAVAEGISILEEVFLKKPLEGDGAYNLRAVHFFKRCMQFSGPIMAKGVEDTLMYTFNRFIAHNEVGDAVDAFGMSAADFHQKMKERQKTIPLSLNGSSTHDTKRGEDVRARLNVLTEMPGEWLQKVQEWQGLTSVLKEEGAPDATDEYFIYQTLIGAYPMPGADTADFGERLKEYLQKALREAKRHSNWSAPNEAYEIAVQNFASGLLDTAHPFWKNFSAFYDKVARLGIVNSLSQVLLKFTCPGVPDVYQGCELWDFSLVDPDNRRPVDYQQRAHWLEELAKGGSQKIELLWKTRVDGKIKLWLVNRLLGLRKAKPQLFSGGDYIPLKVEGMYKENLVAFARRHRQDLLVVIVPLHTANLQLSEKELPDWEDTCITLPKGTLPDWEDLLQGEKGSFEQALLANDILQTLPFAVLQLRTERTERGAGILLHISSLPSRFGIGDLGPEAKAFARFLNRSHQKFWQLLPINPTEAGQAHSPYSSTSSRAGNTLFISPEILLQEGLLREEDLEPHYLPAEAQVAYEEAEAAKAALLWKAWEGFYELGDAAMLKDFEEYCEKEASWLDDFSLYVLLKGLHEGKPWYEWPEEYKLRDNTALTQLKEAHQKELEYSRWCQWVFARQWTAFKNDCNNQGIQLIGDLPFYVSYDSADVWSAQHLFYLDEDDNRLGIAGVPPDAFSADGQLWGMPVYRWDVLKEEGYSWWIERLRKNIELFDLVRLDHFRAFADYWEVPAGEETAKNGTWKEGPGAEFFNAVKDALGDLPFVAEDLGEINDKVLELRDAFGLPGMKILQFAFGEDMGASDYIPHNYSSNFIAYTGTHDNNTTRGWFRQEADEGIKGRLEQYIGHPVSEDNINDVLTRLAYGSVAATVILPMQDVLNLDEGARMNTPSSGSNNWGWRLLPKQLGSTHEQRLKKWTEIYNRR